MRLGSRDRRVTSVLASFLYYLVRPTHEQIQVAVDTRWVYYASPYMCQSAASWLDGGNIRSCSGEEHQGRHNVQAGL